MVNETNPVDAIIESDVPLDWITLEQFGYIIGYPPPRLYHAKAKWPEGLVWQKVDGKLYFSIHGWNQWLNEQATKNYRQALGSSATPSKSTSKSAKLGTKRRSRYHKTKRAQPQPLKLEVN